MIKVLDGALKPSPGLYKYELLTSVFAFYFDRLVIPVCYRRFPVTAYLTLIDIGRMRQGSIPMKRRLTSSITPARPSQRMACENGIKVDPIT